MRRITCATTLGLAAACLTLGLAGCAPTHQAASARPSGFLGDYSQLRPGKEGQALLVYVNPDARWAGYDKMLIDPVAMWADAAKSGLLMDVSREEQQVLIDYLDASLRNALGKDYKLVDRPGAGVLRLRVAITEAEGSAVLLDAASTVVPQLRTLSLAKRITTGTDMFVGKAGIEGELKDSMTDRRLAAAVDRRVGQKSVEGVTNTWGDVQNSFDQWSERLRVRLSELRGR